MNKCFSETSNPHFKGSIRYTNQILPLPNLGHQSCATIDKQNSMACLGNSWTNHNRDKELLCAA